MSSRALRKLQNDAELLESLIGSSGADTSGSEATSRPAVQKTNIFALMNENESSEDDENLRGNESDNDISADENKVTKLETAKTAGLSLPTKSQKKAKRKKNKKKSNQKRKELTEDEELESDGEALEKMIQQYRKKDVQKYGSKRSDSNEELSSDDIFETASEPDDEEVGKLMKSGTLSDLKGDSGFIKFSSKYLKSSSKFFSRDFKKLDPHFEFKMLFDDLTSDSLDDIDSMTSTHVSPQQLKQIQRMKRLLKNWGGKDRRSVPNGPGSSAHRLQFTKIREDWLPTPRGELLMKNLSPADVLDWQLWQRPSDWKDVIEEDLKSWNRMVSFYKFEPLDPDMSKKGMTDFYMSVVLHPDHEALIHLISSKFPYHVPGLLQVALIMVRQGDRSNTNGLIQRALFVFDRALKTGVKFDALSCQLPYIYFFNRQFYLAIFRYILSLAQRGAVGTAGEWCKVLWSLSPLEDPLGCRYFIDHYLLLNEQFEYMIALSQSPLINIYKQWYTLGISMGTILSYLSIGDSPSAKRELKKAFKYHSFQLTSLYLDTLDGRLPSGLPFTAEGRDGEILELKTYMARFQLLWKKPRHVQFLKEELALILTDFGKGLVEVDIGANDAIDKAVDPFYIKDIPINLLRFAILSEESSVMACIPPDIWSSHEVYEFDVLPPIANDRESAETVESIKSFVSDHDIESSQLNVLQDEELLNQIRQISMLEYIENADH